MQYMESHVFLFLYTFIDTLYRLVYAKGILTRGLTLNVAILR